jgi:hypothetical protein
MVTEGYTLKIQSVAKRIGCSALAIFAVAERVDERSPPSLIVGLQRHPAKELTFRPSTLQLQFGHERPVPDQAT